MEDQDGENVSMLILQCCRHRHEGSCAGVGSDVGVESDAEGMIEEMIAKICNVLQHCLIDSGGREWNSASSFDPIVRLA